MTLVCPLTKRLLRKVTLDEAERAISGNGPLRVARRSAAPATPVGPTPEVLLRDDCRAAYPITGGIPVLLGPEILAGPTDALFFDLAAPFYAEAYVEMDHYNAVAGKEAQDIERSEGFACLSKLLSAPPDRASRFPDPKEHWLDARFDCAAQYEAYTFVTPIAGQVVLQLGGKGIHAVKFLLAGAAEAWLVTPMIGEIACAQALAARAGVSHNLHCVAGIAEELPFQAGSFDVIYSGGCLHHTVVSAALAEASRALKRNGRFAAIDPWRTPWYRIGIRVFGKREPNVFCKPLDKRRVSGLYEQFPGGLVQHHGSISRYPLILLDRAGVPISLRWCWRSSRVDDALCSLVPGLRALGGSVNVCGQKTVSAA